MADAYFQASDISKKFGGIVAVDDFSFCVEKGEVVSIIGPNGAGKTTVFNMITGIYPLDTGSIVFNGESIGDKTPRHIVKGGISRTFQNIRLFKNMKVLENVLIGAHTKTNYSLFDSTFRTGRYRKAEDEQIINSLMLLKEVGLYDRKDDYASNLPYGDQRKLEIARAIATGAQLLLLDEPAAGMNPKESEELMDFIRYLKSRKYTILLIEHDMSVVMSISDRIYVLDHGKPIAEGLPNEIANNERVIEAYLGGVHKNDAEGN